MSFKIAELSAFSKAKLGTAEYPVDSVTGICLPDLDPVPDHMFFKCKIILEAD